MKSQLVLSIITFFSITAYAQLDIGIKNIKIVEPAEYLDGETMPENDTVKQIYYEIFNYGSTDIYGADLTNGEVTIDISYNGITKRHLATIMGSIKSNNVRPQRMPEFLNNPAHFYFLPKFPTSAKTLEICISTINADDDATNNQSCISVNLGTQGNPTSVKNSDQPKTNFIIRNKQLTFINAELNSRIEIIDVLGSVQLTQTIINKNETISLSQIQSGVYIVKTPTGSSKIFLP